MNITHFFQSSVLVSALVTASAPAGAAQPVGPGPGPMMIPPAATIPSIPPLPLIPPIAPMAPMGPLPGARPFALLGGPSFEYTGADDRADELYSEGHEAMDEGKYERAIDRFNRLIELKSARTDAALYWKAYSQAKLGQRAEALTTLADLQKQFASSRYLKDAKALEVEVRQASGQTVSPASQDDEELKLMALRGLMQSDPEQTLPILEKMLNAANSPKVKDRVLFVLSQSRSARAREIIAGVARGNGNPDLQLKAIRYIGMTNSVENRQILADVYRASSDSSIKRSILRSFMTSGDRERLFALAKTETDTTLRGEAIRQLGAMRATSELSQLYQSETSTEVKKQILQSMFTGGDAERLIELAKGERDPDLRKTAIRSLGQMRRPGTTEALTTIYASDTAVDVRKTVISALFTQNSAGALVTLARKETNPELKKDIVSKLSNMKSKEAVDYLLELLK